MSEVCAGSTLLFIQPKVVKRQGEFLCLPVEARGYCSDCDALSDISMNIGLPCDVVRKGGNKAGREYVGDMLLDQLTAFGPISTQRFSQSVMEVFLQTDLEKLAGTPFLLDMKPKGRA